MCFIHALNLRVGETKVFIENFWLIQNKMFQLYKEYLKNTKIQEILNYNFTALWFVIEICCIFNAWFIQKGKCCTKAMMNQIIQLVIKMYTYMHGLFNWLII